MRYYRASHHHTPHTHTHTQSLSRLATSASATASSFSSSFSIYFYFFLLISSSSSTQSTVSVRVYILRWVERARVELLVLPRRPIVIIINSQKRCAHHPIAVYTYTYTYAYGVRQWWKGEERRGEKSRGGISRADSQTLLPLVIMTRLLRSLGSILLSNMQQQQGRGCVLCVCTSIWIRHLYGARARRSWKLLVNMIP